MSQEKSKVVAKSLGVVHEVVIEAFRSKEDETMKNATLSIPLVTNFSQIKGDTLEIDINTFSKESGFLLEKDSFRLEIALLLETWQHFVLALFFPFVFVLEMFALFQTIWDISFVVNDMLRMKFSFGNYMCCVSLGNRWVCVVGRMPSPFTKR